MILVKRIDIEEMLEYFGIDYHKYFVDMLEGYLKQKRDKDMLSTPSRRVIYELISEFLEDLKKCNIYNYPKELDSIIKKWKMINNEW